MKAQCQTCRKMWGISILQEIPRSGYECPRCAKKKKRREKG